MKKIIFIAAIAALIACGNKSKEMAANANNLVQQKTEIPESLNNEEAVVKQVKAVYDYLNNRKEGQPWLDEKFGTKEWQQTMQKLEMVDQRRDEGFYADGFNPWSFEYYGEKVTAEDIKAEILPNGMARVSFTLKDNESEGEDVIWLMKVEDGQWRVNTIFNGESDLLVNMRTYIEDAKFIVGFDINKYIADMNSQASKIDGGKVTFGNFALVDIDRDGKPELCATSLEPEYNAVFSIASGKAKLLEMADSRSNLVYYEHGVGVQGSCGTGCHMSSFTVLKNSLADYSFTVNEQYDMEGKLMETKCSKDGKDIPYEDAMTMLDNGALGETVQVQPEWHMVN